MSIFCFKKLPPTTSLGQQLRRRREERAITLGDIANTTHIQKKYLQAIEQGAWRALPKSKTFRLAYVRELAELLGLEGRTCLTQFEYEGGLDDVVAVHPHPGIAFSPFASVAGAARFIALVGGVAVFGFYLSGQVIRIVRPPRLLVYTPVEGEVVAGGNALIRGETEREAALTVNGQGAMVNEQGKFEAKIDLIEGVNTITVAAIKKRGRKTATVTRHIVGQRPAEQVSLNYNENDDRVGL